MAVAADEDMGAWPVVREIGQEPDQEHGIFRPGGAGARAEARCDERVGGPFKNEEWQILLVLIVMIVEGKLLLAIGGIIGVVQIQHNGC